MFDSLRRLGYSADFVEDSSVTEIMINGMDHIFVEQDGQLQELDRAFDSVEKNYRMSFSRLWWGVIAWSMKRHPS